MEMILIPYEFYPYLAPLSIPLAEHILAAPGKRQVKTIEAFIRDIASMSRVAYTYMSPFVQLSMLQGDKATKIDKTISTPWLLDAIKYNSPNKIALSAQTVSLWHKKNLLRYIEHGLPEYTSTAALLTARLIDHRERGWLPQMIDPQEPYWWGWRLDSPDSQPQPCPIPLPDNLPTSTLLYTHWEGAEWEKTGWKTFRGLGSIRFAGGVSPHMRANWRVTREDFNQWDTPLSSLIPALLGKEREESLLEMALPLILMRLAVRYLPKPFAPKLLKDTT